MLGCSGFDGLYSVSLHNFTGNLEVHTDAGQILVTAISVRFWRTKSIARPLTRTLIPTLPKPVSM